MTTTALDTAEARRLLDAIDTGTPAGLRDRALIGLMSCSGCSARAALRLRVADLDLHRAGARVSVQEDGQAPRAVALGREVAPWLLDYVRQCGLAGTPGAVLWRAAAAAHPGRLLARPMSQQEVFAMVQARAEAAGIRTRLGFGAFRAHGLAGYFANAEWLAPDEADAQAPRPPAPVAGSRGADGTARWPVVPALAPRRHGPSGSGSRP